MSQGRFIELLGTTQPRVTKIEAAAKGVSVNQMFRALFATAGGLADLVRGLEPPKATKQAARTSPARGRLATIVKKSSKARAWTKLACLGLIFLISPRHPGEMISPKRSLLARTTFVDGIAVVYLDN